MCVPASYTHWKPNSRDALNLKRADPGTSRDALSFRYRADLRYCFQTVVVRFAREHRKWDWSCTRQKVWSKKQLVASARTLALGPLSLNPLKSAEGVHGSTNNLKSGSWDPLGGASVGSPVLLSFLEVFVCTPSICFLYMYVYFVCVCLRFACNCACAFRRHNKDKQMFIWLKFVLSNMNPIQIIYSMFLITRLRRY